jgi:hypothetical protein
MNFFELPGNFFELPPPSEQPEPSFEIPEPKPWWHPPSNELGSPVPLRVVLARTDQVAAALVGMTAYTTGVSFTFALRSRSSQNEEGFHPEMVFGGGALRRRPGEELPSELLRFGVQFADGRKARTTLDGDTPWGVEGGEDKAPSGPILTHLQSGGGGREWNTDYWLWPLPPPGALTFAIEWPSKKIALSTHEVDASLIIEASKSSEVLWPAAGGGEGGTTVWTLRDAAEVDYPKDDESA